MKLTIVMPVWLQEKPVLDMTIRAVESIQAPIGTKLIVVPTRLKPELITADELARTLHAQVPWQSGQDLSVAAAWNLGVMIAGQVDRVLIMANDTELDPSCIKHLLAYDEADLWTGASTTDDPTPRDDVTEGPDYSCFMFRPSMMERFGTFDERFRPAYWEDIDHHTRIVQGGGHAYKVHRARFIHHGSATMRLDPEAAHHVRHWFEINRARYRDKWGPSISPNTEEATRQQCFSHPWNDARLPVSFWDR